MSTCPECGAEWPKGTAACEACGADLAPTPEAPVIAGSADFDQEAERQRFEARYGIDIGDRTVDEYLSFLDRQDYSPTRWFWVVVAVQLASVGLIAFALFGPGGWEVVPALFPLSVLLAVAILADTAHVGLFRRWSPTRWLYVLIALIPLPGQISTFLYLLLRRLKRQQTERHRRRLFESGIDLASYPSQD